MKTAINSSEKSLLLQAKDGILNVEDVKTFDRKTFGYYAKSLQDKGLVKLFESEEDGPEMIALTDLGMKAVKRLSEK